MQEYAEIIAELKQELPGLLERENIPGAAIAIVNAEGILWEAGFGVAGRQNPTPVTPYTLFSLQSCSKTFTATAILIAVQEGLLELDRPIAEYLPDFSLQSRFETHPERLITLRHLLSHKAGLTHEAPLGSNYTSTAEEVAFEQHIQGIRQTWLRFPVGQRYSYSNLGVDLAGYILQQVSGLPFAEYVRQKLFIPLGMTHSAFDFNQAQAFPERALGHDRFLAALGGDLPQRVPMIPSGGLFAAAGDVARFIRFHLNRGRVDGKVILDEKYLQEMYTVPFPGEGQFEGYGLGIAINRIRQTTLLHHGGGGFGFLSDIQWYPELDLGIAFLTNSASHNLQWDFANETLDRLLGPAPEKPAQEMPDANVRKENDSARLAFIGHYIGRLPESWFVHLTDKGFGLSLGGSREFRLLNFYRFNQAYTQTEYRTSHWRFILDTQGRPQRLVHLDSGNMFDYNSGPSDPPGENKPEWRTYTGAYLAYIYGVIPDLMKIRIKRGALYLSLENPARRIALRLEEHRPGLFFTTTGEAVDFTGERPLFCGVPFQRIGLGEELRQWWMLLRGQLRMRRTNRQNP